MGRPLFKRVLLRIEKAEENVLFGEEIKKPKVWIEDAAVDCDLQVLDNIGQEVLFNDVIIQIVEEGKEFKKVLTHETNLLQIVR